MAPGDRAGAGHDATRLHRRAPGPAGVADISEFACRDEILYLAGIRDLFDRTLVGWSMGERQATGLDVAALVMAHGRRNPTVNTIHRADHGTQGQSTSLEFTNRLHDWDLVHSYGSVGDCFDHVAMETFWTA
jgi:putative transposase